MLSQGENAGNRIQRKTTYKPDFNSPSLYATLGVMSETDNPLKLLITEYREAFAAWLLGRGVSFVRPLNVEFPAQGARSDLLFEVVDTLGNLIYLHIELQGPRSSEPMPLRMLDYLTRIIRRDIGIPQDAQAPRLQGVVIYVGEGAGEVIRGTMRFWGWTGTSACAGNTRPCACGRWMPRICWHWAVPLCLR